MKEIKILLVDDHKMIRHGLRSIINFSHNMRIIDECSNGKEAINYLEKNSSKIDVILMDITMPEMNGIDATEIVTKLYPEINILALTMHAEEAYIIKMIKAGALGYVLKDSGAEKLIEGIKTVYHKEKFYSNEVSLKLINLLLDKGGAAKPTLSDRELEIIKAISYGNTSKEIASKLFISPRTVESHRRNITKKLNLKNTSEVIKYAFNNNLVS